MSRKVTIVIPNYNGAKFITKCFSALKKQTFTDFDVILVDNGSLDDSVSLAEKEAQGLDLKIINLDLNYGFSKAVNEGIKASDAEFVILLNTDAYAGKNFVSALYERITENDNIFSAQAMMLQYADRRLIDSAGDYFSAMGWAFALGRDKNCRLYTEPYDIFSACAGAAIYRKEVFEKIGYFDENFFAYLEDVDIGFRARINGYRNVYEPAARVLHVGSGNTGSRHNEFKVRLSARNSMLVMYKNFLPWQKVVNFLPVVLGIAVKTAYFKKKNLAGAYIGGIKDSFYLMKKSEKTTSEYMEIYSMETERELIKNIFRRLTMKSE